MKRKHVAAPVELWNPGAVEKWLECEAEKGWRLYGLGGHLAHFERMEPGQYRARLYPAKRDEPYDRTQSRRETFAELGWQFAAENVEYEIYYCADPAAPEVDTDPVAQQWAWETQLRKSWRSGWICLALLLLIQGWIFWMVKSGESPFRMLAQRGWLVLLADARLLPDAWMLVRQLRTVFRARRRLRSGVEPERGGDWKTMRRRAALSLMGQITIWVVLILVNIVLPATQDRSVTLDETLPYVAAARLDAEFASAEPVVSHAKRSRALLIPESYEIYEVFSGQLRASSTYDRAAFSALAKALYGEMLEKQQAEWPAAERLPCPMEGIDEAELLQFEGMQYFLARQGRKVYSVWVNGGAELSNNLADFGTVLTEN